MLRWLDSGPTWATYPVMVLLWGLFWGLLLSPELYALWRLVNHIMSH